MKASMGEQDGVQEVGQQEAEGLSGNSATGPCAFYLQRKKRHCRMLVKPGKRFCGEHATLEDADDVRMPCPKDPKHTCDSRKLAAHLRVCPAASMAALGAPYCEAGANLNMRPPAPVRRQEVPFTLASFGDARLSELISKVDEVYLSLALDEAVKEEHLKHPVVEEAIRGDPSLGPSALKHLVQNSSLLGHLRRCRLLESKGDPSKGRRVFVEFGSGRGQLTYWLAKACSRKRTDEEDGGVQGDEGPVLVPAHVLVDKASHRHKYDNKLKDGGHDSAANVHRVRCDIQDLVLAKVPAVRDGAGDDDDAGRSSQPTGLIGVSKHLCGAATDYALQCLANFRRSSACQAGENEVDDPGPSSGNDSHQKLEGLMIALCCHHRCSYEDFVGKEALVDEFGFQPSDFPVLCGLTSWATCGSGKPRPGERGLLDGPSTSQDSAGTTEPAVAAPAAQDQGHRQRLGLTRPRSEEIGRRCKRVLDLARARFIGKSLGLDHVELRYYVPADVSLENVVLLAYR